MFILHIILHSLLDEQCRVFISSNDSKQLNRIVLLVLLSASCYQFSTVRLG